MGQSSHCQYSLHNLLASEGLCGLPEHRKIILFMYEPRTTYSESLALNGWPTCVVVVNVQQHRKDT